MPKGIVKKLAGNDPKLRIDLKELFGENIPDSQLFRQSFGQAVLDKIRERTEENKDVEGKRFRNYSKAYAESIEFAAYGKSKSDPNLQLTGDMMAFMDVIDEGEGFIEIGWADSEEAAKAHGHITGNVGVKRDFFGLRPSEVRDLVEEFSEVIEDVPSDEQADLLAEFGRVSGDAVPQRFVLMRELLNRLIEDADET